MRFRKNYAWMSDVAITPENSSSCRPKIEVHFKVGQSVSGVIAKFGVVCLRSGLVIRRTDKSGKWYLTVT
ncbi:hypothetical protein CCGE525_37330 (plasmid) [Rhizobium jaguaris]|uniref:Uncharacterized protein n=1 Tax=Rhizobium jaguaris TaxID=1312183 RepID=A0A387G3J2_9HYPH|nr:hypothetical protein CCGE525_37330 [Rhizobium jaguaris]